MKKSLRALVSGAVLAVCFLFIAFHGSFRYFIPSQQVELSHGVQYGAVLKDFLFVQEITMKKRYLSGVDVYMAKLPGPYTNSNVFLLMDDQQRILYTRKFSSSDFGEALHFPFRFGKTFDIGKNKTVFACIYSVDSDQQNYIGLARKEGSTLGKLYVLPILQNDIPGSFASRQGIVNFTGTLGIKTFESETKYFTLLQVILYLIAILLALTIFYWPSVRKFVVGIRLKPGRIFLSLAGSFGLIMLFITPPLQVPDEPAHLFRSYQVAEFNWFKIRDNIPRGLASLADSCQRMNFSTHEKTKPSEILAFSSIPLEGGDRVTRESPNYILPYFPQAIGIIIAKILNLNILWHFYLARFFNLVVTILLLVLAIRITPVFKWVFAFVGILPMSLYQFASLSYDATTIALSLLLLSLILHRAFTDPPKKGHMFWIPLLVVTLLLAASKPPYFLVLLSFLIIPVIKTGSMRRYILIFTGLLLSAMVVSQLWSPARKAIQKLAVEGFSYPSTLVASLPDDYFPDRPGTQYPRMAFALPLLPHDKAPESPAVTGAQNIAQNPIDPMGQVKFILTNPFEYTGVLLRTLRESGNLYVVSIVGLFGWIDTQVPGPVAYLYLLLLIILALITPVKGITITLKQKAILFVTFLVCYLLIETALYLYCNPVGSPKIIAVQGRYFIGILPVLLMMFYHSEGDRNLFRRGYNFKSEKKRSPARPHKANIFIATENLSVYTALLTLYGILVLLWSLYLIIDRFFVLQL